jgi:hypothetical protein
MNDKDILLNAYYSINQNNSRWYDGDGPALQIAAVLRALIKHKSENVYDANDGKVNVVRVDEVLKIIEELNDV